MQDPVEHPSDSWSAGPSECLWNPPQVAQPVCSTWLSAFRLTAMGLLAAACAGPAATARLRACPRSLPSGPGASLLRGALGMGAALARGALGMGAALTCVVPGTNARSSGWDGASPSRGAELACGALGMGGGLACGALGM